jgi:subtilisin family serine protease
LDTKYDYNFDGNNVRVYVIDTGILYTHTEFATGRAVKGYDFATPRGTAGDCNGHGTHVCRL